MAQNIRTAVPSELDEVTTLLIAGADARHTQNPDLWRLDGATRDKTFSTIKQAMENENPAFRQQWLVAESEGRLVGVMHSILLPVPPIYAGDMGPPGLIMEDCVVSPGAPQGTAHDLLKAAEGDLRQAGAKILLASSVSDGAWEPEYAVHGYDPLTCYFAKTGLSEPRSLVDVHPATDRDVAGIVASSAAHRQILHGLHRRFWKPHDDADARFGAWMRRSLSLEDRDMFVARDRGGFRGYAISQPATALHFPTPHDISGVGVIDDFFHSDLKDPHAGTARGTEAAALFEAAEAARQCRGDHSVLVVCPAAWRSKIALLEAMGYGNAITWHIKIVG